MRLVACAVCAEERYRPFLTEDSFEVVTCQGCGHLYTRRVPDAEDYDEIYEASGNWIRSAEVSKDSGSSGRFRYYVSEVGRLLAKGACVLEIGCSKGHFLKHLQDAGFDCHGIEPSRDARVAQNLLGQGRVQRGFYRAPLPLAADAVVMLEVLEHIPEPQKIVAVVSQQLKPGGYFLGSVPNSGFVRLKVWPKRVFGMNTFIVPLTMDAGNHINYFSAGGLRRMLEQASFDVVRVGNGPPDFNYLANRFSPYVKRIWSGAAKSAEAFGGVLLGTNLFFIAQKRV